MSPQTMASVGLLLLRVMTGLGIASHGFPKFGRMEQFTQGVAAMGFPLPFAFAWAAALSEAVGGLLIAAGLWTRGASFFVACTMGVAFFVRHAQDPFSRKELALAYLVAAVALALMGPGPYSLDRYIRKKA